MNISNTTTRVKQENQIYVRSLEEFIESNIKWINDLIDHKQKTNFAVIELNARWKNVAADLDFEMKKRSQLKTEVTNAINANNSVTAQNNDMLNKISIIRQKTKDWNVKYAQVHGSHFVLFCRGNRAKA